MKLPHLSNIGNNIKKNYFQKVQKCFKENVCLLTCNETNKTAMFSSAKYNFPVHTKNKLYLHSSDCNKDCDWKTDCDLGTKSNENDFCEDQLLY